MLQSNLFSKTSKTSPEGEESKNAKLLIKAGFIAKSSSGVYSLLPLGLRVLEKINRIIREEMNAIGAEEMLMPALIDKKYWEKSGRWETEVVYRTGKQGLGTRKQENDNVAHDFEYGLGWTHEEVIAHIAVNFIQSYKDLPKSVYQIQNKFRAETRAQAGLLRGREFLMKDLYSFHADESDLNRFYEIAKEAYKNVFKRIGLKALVVEASGGDFTKDYTHEFQVLNPAGEDTVYYCEKCGFAQNKEIYELKNHKTCKAEIKESRGIEVGNIFKLGTRFSEAFGLKFLDNAGAKKPVIMGSYGLGPTRIMGTIVEEFNDEKGIVWPEPVAPFQAHLLNLNSKNTKPAENVYVALQKAGIEVLYDNREVSAGEKFADADLIGIPLRAVVSEKTGEKVEVKKRSEEASKLIEVNRFIEIFS